MSTPVKGMEFTIASDVVEYSDAVFTIVSAGDGAFKIYVSRSKYVPQTQDTPIECKDRAEMSQTVIRIMFGDGGPEISV
jgi:hypothetical protein